MCATLFLFNPFRTLHRLAHPLHGFELWRFLLFCFAFCFGFAFVLAVPIPCGRCRSCLLAIDSYASASSKERRVGEKDSVCTSHCRRGSPPPTTSSPHSPSDCVSRSMPSQPDPCLMDESWFVTPPPCFTAEGPNPVSMESNPMEDLLIEHPSMSVYVTSIVVERETPEEHIGDG